MPWWFDSRCGDLLPRADSFPLSCGVRRSDCFTHDANHNTTSRDPIQVPIGLVTRAQAKKFKDVLNGLIQEFWTQANSWRPIEHDPRVQQRCINMIQVLEESDKG
ncbi:hypothetical protein TIFTF001_029401 [Ficus carica]|uniref:Uncharacterized protein n=1 Tax=Ficus carica TaxID=3494 RepID=A0AA88DRR3_FICCA|nr:hypothetical protein TIFTF001_029401 [Ficus carica]